MLVCYEGVTLERVEAMPAKPAVKATKDDQLLRQSIPIEADEEREIAQRKARPSRHG